MPSSSNESARRFGALVALGIVVSAFVALAFATHAREESAAIAIIGCVGALILSALPAIARFSGRA